VTDEKPKAARKPANTGSKAMARNGGRKGAAARKLNAAKRKAEKEGRT
jgi:hypothetical protein